MSTKLYSYAGMFASVVLVAFGAGALYMGFDGRDRVRDELAREQIVGTDDSTIPGQKVDTGEEAQAAAAKDPETGQPVENGLRNLWVTSTALSTALNTAYFAESVATFANVMGVALLFTGIGFLVLTARVLWPAGAPGRAARDGSAVPSTT